MAQTPRSAPAVRIGEVFLGKYQVEAIIGHGGMGIVAECTHLALGERVALKMLRPDVLLDRDAVERFMREAQASAKLRSEYVARVTDVGELENGTPYMVMEFLDGQDLGNLLLERRRLNIGWAIQLILQACEALAEAHALGIVHRDVKPQNLFVTWRPDGTSLIKVLDFGISKGPTAADLQLTQTQSLLGTPAYMSPEQMRSARTVDPRSDIWSLGTVLYELIEGRRPFEAESFSEMCVKVAVDPPSPMELAPRELAEVLTKCLAKNPAQRFATMADLARELAPFANDRHQATMLVERMERMHRRSSVERDHTPVPARPRSNPALRLIPTPPPPQNVAADEATRDSIPPIPTPPRGIAVVDDPPTTPLARPVPSSGDLTRFIERALPSSTDPPTFVAERAPASSTEPPTMLAPRPPPASTEPPDLGEIASVPLGIAVDASTPATSPSSFYRARQPRWGRIALIAGLLSSAGVTATLMLAGQPLASSTSGAPATVGTELPSSDVPTETRPDPGSTPTVASPADPPVDPTRSSQTPIDVSPPKTIDRPITPGTADVGAGTKPGPSPTVKRPTRVRATGSAKAPTTPKAVTPPVEVAPPPPPPPPPKPKCDVFGSENGNCAPPKAR